VKLLLGSILWFLPTLVSTGIANAGPIVWNLSTLNFDIFGGVPAGHQGTVTGSFIFDADTTTYTTWSILLSGFAGTGADGLLLTPATSTTGSFAPGLVFSLLSNQKDPNGGFLAVVNLSFFPALTDAGGTTSVGGNLALDTPDFSTFVTPGGTVSSAPEPSAGVLVLAGAGFAFCLWRQVPGRNPIRVGLARYLLARRGISDS
jgi:hypothetical protein